MLPAPGGLARYMEQAVSSAPYSLVDFHGILRDMASAYLRLEALSASSDPNHIEFWEIIERLFPYEAEEESRLPGESLYVGDAAVCFGKMRDTSAHRLIYRLCIEALEGIMQIAHEIVPNPPRNRWPPKEQLGLSALATIPRDGLDVLLSLIYGDRNDNLTDSIMRRLHLESLQTELSEIHLSLEMEYHRAVHRQAIIAEKRYTTSQMVPVEAAAEELGRTAEAVLSIIKAQPKKQGINGKGIIKELKARGIHLAESSLRKHILPKLAQYGVVNHRGAAELDIQIERWREPG